MQVNQTLHVLITLDTSVTDGLGAVAAAIIFYVLVGDQGAKFFPNIQQKLVGALDMTDTTSIVPYQFDAGGGVR